VGPAGVGRLVGTGGCGVRNSQAKHPSHSASFFYINISAGSSHKKVCWGIPHRTTLGLMRSEDLLLFSNANRANIKSSIQNEIINSLTFFLVLIQNFYCAFLDLSYCSINLI